MTLCFFSVLKEFIQITRSTYQQPKGSRATCRVCLHGRWSLRSSVPFRIQFPQDTGWTCPPRGTMGPCRSDSIAMTKVSSSKTLDSSTMAYLDSLALGTVSFWHTIGLLKSVHMAIRPGLHKLTVTWVPSSWTFRWLQAPERSQGSHSQIQFLIQKLWANCCWKPWNQGAVT